MKNLELYINFFYIMVELQLVKKKKTKQTGNYALGP